MSVRGKIRNREQSGQVRDFSKLRFGNVTPTDIDGYLEFLNRVFIYLELKYRGYPMPMGQRVALERGCKRIQDGGGDAYVLVAKHFSPPDEDIDASELPLTHLFHKGRWESVDCPCSVREAIIHILDTHGILWMYPPK